MAIEYGDGNLRMVEAIAIQEVDQLQEWLLENFTARLDLSQCQHMHTAVLQTLCSAQLNITAWPADELFRGCIEPLLANME